MAKVHSLRPGYGSHKCSSCEVYSDFDSDKYYGLCPNCWANLGDDERAALSGQLPLMEPVVTTYRIPTVSFPRIYLAMLAAVCTPKAFALIFGWLSNTSLWHWLSRLLVLAIAVFVLTGCKDATRAQWGAMGSKHVITVYSGGVAVKVFHSTGNVSNQEQSDGYYFEDATTHKLVEVSGTVVIEQE